MNKNALDRLAQRIAALEIRRGNDRRWHTMTAAGPWWNTVAIEAEAEQNWATRRLAERDRVIVRSILPYEQRPGETTGDACKREARAAWLPWPPRPPRL